MSFKRTRPTNAARKAASEVKMRWLPRIIFPLSFNSPPVAPTSTLPSVNLNYKAGMLQGSVVGPHFFIFVLIGLQPTLQRIDDSK